VRDYRSDADREFAFFHQCRTLEQAIRFAALSLSPDEKRHPHQQRIPADVLAEGERNLQSCAAELASSESFADVHEICVRELSGIRGIGLLTTYDVATRVGAHLGHEPDRVYLHAGVADGARALGLNHRRESLGIEELPDAFRRLRPREIEDCLCIFKRELAEQSTS
jgi:hypothetical protein